MKILISTSNGVQIKTVLLPMKLGEDLAKHREMYGDFSWRQVTDEEIPSDRTFRAAWRDGGEKIVVDANHAARIQSLNLAFRKQAEEKESALAEMLRSTAAVSDTNLIG